MALNSILYAGTSGQGVWRSVDNGETFQRRCAGMFMEAEVRALVSDPSDPGVLYAGTDAGLYRTANGGEHWVRMDAPFDPGSGWHQVLGLGSPTGELAYSTVASSRCSWM